MEHAARRGQVVPARVLGIQPALESVSARHNLALGERQRPPGGDLDLQADEIEARDRFRHRVLDLKPRVHLEEIEAAVLVEQKLDRAGIGVADRFRDGGRRRGHLRAQRRRHGQ